MYRPVSQLHEHNFCKAFSQMRMYNVECSKLQAYSKIRSCLVLVDLYNKDDVAHFISPMYVT